MKKDDNNDLTGAVFMIQITSNHESLRSDEFVAVPVPLVCTSVAMAHMSCLYDHLSFCFPATFPIVSNNKASV